jgi:hypothetical protein
MRHELQAGAELSGGGWVDRRMRTGGMTWRPPRLRGMDPDDPATWVFSGLIPTDWGGEVDLHARTGRPRCLCRTASPCTRASG